MSDLNEELLERIQGFWQVYKFHLIITLLMILSAVAGLLYQSAYNAEARQIAGDNFFTLIQAADEGDTEAAEAALAGIDGDTFPEMHNLALMALAAAQNTQGDATAAIARLRQVVEQETDEGLQRAAVLRLAELLINNEQSDEALVVLEGGLVEGKGAIKVLFAERRGDAHYAGGRLRQAREEYLSAREEAFTSFRSYLPVLNIKIGAVNSLPVDEDESLNQDIKTENKEGAANDTTDAAADSSVSDSATTENQ